MQGYLIGIAYCLFFFIFVSINFYAPVASARQGHRGIGLSVRVYVHSPSVDQVKVESQDLLMVAS